MTAHFTGFLKSLRPNPTEDMKALATAIDAVAEAVSCKDIHDGVCHLDGKNQCRCRDAAERVISITLDHQKEASFQP